MKSEKEAGGGVGGGNGGARKRHGKHKWIEKKGCPPNDKNKQKDLRASRS